MEAVRPKGPTSGRQDGGNDALHARMGGGLNALMQGLPGAMHDGKLNRIAQHGALQEMMPFKNFPLPRFERGTLEESAPMLAANHAEKTEKLEGIGRPPKASSAVAAPVLASRPPIIPSLQATDAVAPPAGTKASTPAELIHPTTTEPSNSGNACKAVTSAHNSPTSSSASQLANITLIAVNT